jgi:hypothetical protein
MELEGTVHNGVVVLDAEAPLPEGTRVKVTPCEPVPSVSTHYEIFRDIIGKAEGLPEDFALNHNHYIRGGPKK